MEINFKDPEAIKLLEDRKRKAMDGIIAGCRKFNVPYTVNTFNKRYLMIQPDIIIDGVVAVAVVPWSASWSRKAREKWEAVIKSKCRKPVPKGIVVSSDAEFSRIIESYGDVFLS